MLRSMYAGVAGMKGFQTKLDVIGNNIANVNTIGFKKSTINFQDLLSQNLSSGGVNPMQVGLGSTTSSINVVHTPGSTMMTGVSSDLSVMGPGFFVVQKPEDVGTDEGRFLTKAGNFIVNAEGNLVTSQRYNVLSSDNEAINIDPELYDSYAINSLGEVIGKTPEGEEELIATIGLAAPENPAGLKSSGGSLYEMTSNADMGGLELDTPTGLSMSIGSGQLEMSNVDLTEEFTELIIAQRGFQANSRTITTSDEILQEVVNLKR